MPMNRTSAPARRSSFRLFQIGRQDRHLAIVTMFVPACVVLAASWRTDLVAPALALLALLMLGLGRDPRDLGFFVVGVVLGGGLDLAQTAVGTTVYAVSGPLAIPSFVLLYWGMAGIVVHHAVQTVGPVPARRGDAVLLVWALALSLVANRSPITVTILLTLGTATRLLLHRRAGDLRLALLAACAGPLLEALLIRSGLYTMPSAPRGWPVPLWLPSLYACVGLTARSWVPALASALARAFGRTSPD